ELTETYTSKNYTKYDPMTGRPVGDPYISSISYAADRVANGIICRNEKVTLTLSNSGYVTNYNLRYNPTIKYPEPKNIISASKAYSQFFKNTELSLRYRLAYRYEDKKTVSALVYSAANTMRIDAFTGKKVNYDGSEYIDYNPEISNYTDLENSKYKAVAEKMKKYGIVLMDEKGRLNENEVITALDFANLLNGILSGSYGAYYSSAPDIDIKEEDKLTREKAAVIVVSMRYGNEIAEMTSIFAEKFTDVPKTNKYIGYINISDASGLIKGNGNKFSPNKAYTRGDALMFAYNLLSK
ncbi:MAG: S-layer homology domain-containing protein, partial [Ruminiclostridium sp.]|nr:S-layer homology domain-containing protein [Ruminiclostridium sp.]